MVDAAAASPMIAAALDVNSFLTQWSNWIAIGFLVLMLIILRVSGKLPNIDGVTGLVNAINSRGGNILVLALFSAFFFQVGMRFMYFSLNMISEKRLTENNAVLMLGLQFVTGSAFGSAFGAMLKSMSPTDTTMGPPQSVTVDIPKTPIPSAQPATVEVAPTPEEPKV